jgi:hypothetical protein
MANARPRAWIAADVCRIADAVLVEQLGTCCGMKSPKPSPFSGRPMFG